MSCNQKTATRSSADADRLFNAQHNSTASEMPQSHRLHNAYDFLLVVFSALTLLVRRQGGAGMVICLEQGADLHMTQLMPLPLTVSCFSKIHTGFTFLVPAHPGSPGQRAVKRVCVCVPISGQQ